ncbi:MAG TPA: DUF2309 domain-containing protein, partial [Longimicrobiales bacterium]|nr:DUF2309 domain-containing protein [Longimicrobiales bacterium]
GARSTMPRAWYREQVEAGRIEDRHLARAIPAAREAAQRRAEILRHLPTDVVELREHLHPDCANVTRTPDPVVADAARRVSGLAWDEIVRDRVSAWASDHFDEGQAAWASPWSDAGVWRAWRADAAIDRTPEVMGLSAFRAFVRSLPTDAAEARADLTDELNLADDDLELYLHRLLMQVGGWSAWAGRRLFEADLAGGDDTSITDLLTVLLAWEVAMLRCYESLEIRTVWHELRRQAEQGPDRERAEAALRVDLLLQDAFEQAEHERMVGRFERHAASRTMETEDQRPLLQAAFCIDVRSEVLRRALEQVAPRTQTIGFAGFFGVALDYQPVGETRRQALCPVLLTPGAEAREVVIGDEAESERLGLVRGLRRRASTAWTSFKMGAVSCFGFVGPVGLAYAAKLIVDGFGRTRPADVPGTDGLTPSERDLLAPELGLSFHARIDTAESILRGMSLTTDFARVVVLAGHGSTTTNNPHASGLDCGACGGRGGEVNARVAADLLNDAAVRTRLRKRGIRIPDDTVFVAARHDTTTDDVTILDAAALPDSHERDLKRVRQWFAEASGLARRERAPALGLKPEAPELATRIRERARDWSQVRPEWGLAGCSSFVAAPRERTAGLDLGGRAFLHSYDWGQDEQFDVLELILTAPAVVASWISLQYYGSTVDPAVFGSGNKTLHNVVGTVGVLEGNGGDLRVGLPMQSVSDGERTMHEPLRLNVIVEAPIEAMSAVIERNEHLRHLVDHGWMHLWAMGASGRLTHRYVGEGRWARVRPALRSAVADRSAEAAA